MTDVPRDKWVEVGGLSLHYRDWGDAGQPLVLLHGLASTCHIWDLAAPLLAGDFRVVALDQRGHGESAKPQEGYDFATVASDLGGFLTALGLRQPILVGHSWGGDVALEFEAANPGAVRGLCFVDGGMIEPSTRPGMTLERARREMAPPILEGIAPEEFLAVARSGQLGPYLTPEVEQALLANFEVLEDNTLRPQLSRENHLRIIDALWEHRPSLLYPRVTCPTLLLPARQRDGTSAAERRQRREESVAIAAGSLPLSKTVWLEDSIHDVPWQRPALVAWMIKEHVERGFFSRRAD